MVLKKRITKNADFKIRISHDELADFRALAAELGVSVADIFREGAKQLAIKERRKLNSFPAPPQGG